MPREHIFVVGFDEALFHLRLAVRELSHQVIVFFLAAAVIVPLVVGEVGGTAQRCSSSVWWDGRCIERLLPVLP